MSYAIGYALLPTGQIHARALSVGHDEAIAQLAALQFGVVSRSQLLSLGLSQSAIEHRLACGRLRPLHRGVYAVGHEALVFRGHAMAGALSTGRGSTVSLWTASALTRGVPHRGPIHITTLHRHSKQAGIRLHRGRLRADETTFLHGIPVTTPARTLLDLSRVMPAAALRRLIKSEEADNRIAFDDLRAILDRYPRKQGRRALSEVVAGVHATSGRTRSELEDRFTTFIAAAQLPQPERNMRMSISGRTIEIDCLWQNERLALELDGRDAHARTLAFDDDRARDRALAAAGLTPVRVTWNDLAHRPGELEAELSAVLGLGLRSDRLRVCA